MNRYSLFIPFILFTFFFIPFISIPPCWDAARELHRANTLFDQGLQAYVRIPGRHPPLDPFFVFISYTIGGRSVVSYNAIGLLLGYIGIIAIYFLGKTLWNNKVGLIAATLLSTCPLFIANSVNHLTDYGVTIFILISLYFYAKKKFFHYAFASSMAILTKETALILPLTVFLIELLFTIRKNQTKKIYLLKFLLLLIPFFIFSLWYQFIQITNTDISMGYGGYISAESSMKGPYMTILHNMVTFRFINRYAFDHITKMIYLNFTWVYWLIAGIGITAFFRTIQYTKIIIHIKQGEQRTKTFLVIFAIFILYILTVLTMQVSATARYHLPLIVLLLLTVSWIISRHLIRIPVFVLIFFSVFNFIRLFYSLDPITILFLGKQFTQEQYVYTKSTGDDSFVYNLQYLLILKNRKRVLDSRENISYSSKLCEFNR